MSLKEKAEKYRTLKDTLIKEIGEYIKLYDRYDKLYKNKWFDKKYDSIKNIFTDEGFNTEKDNEHDRIVATLYDYSFIIGHNSEKYSDSIIVCQRTPKTENNCIKLIPATSQYHPKKKYVQIHRPDMTKPIILIDWLESEKIGLSNGEYSEQEVMEFIAEIDNETTLLKNEISKIEHNEIEYTISYNGEELKDLVILLVNKLE